MVVKLVKTVARSDGSLIIGDGSGTVADAYLSKGWSVLGILPGATSNEVLFVLRQDDPIAASAEMLEAADVLDASELRDTA